MMLEFVVNPDLILRSCCNLSDGKVWVLKLSKWGIIPTLRTAHNVIANMAAPVTVPVNIPAHDEFKLVAVFDSSRANYIQNTYYCSYDLLSTESRKETGECTPIYNNLPTESYLFLVKTVGYRDKLPILAPTDMRLQQLTDLGLLLVNMPIMESEDVRFLVN